MRGWSWARANGCVPRTPTLKEAGAREGTWARVRGRAGWQCVRVGCSLLVPGWVAACSVPEVRHQRVTTALHAPPKVLLGVGLGKLNDGGHWVPRPHAHVHAVGSVTLPSGNPVHARLPHEHHVLQPTTVGPKQDLGFKLQKKGGTVPFGRGQEPCKGRMCECVWVVGGWVGGSGTVLRPLQKHP
jgi:hypothetical protein